MLQCLGKKSIKKKEIILKEGSNCRDVFFVVSGLLRVYFVDKEGDEKTFPFCFGKYLCNRL